MQRRSFLGSLLALLIPLPKVVPKLVKWEKEVLPIFDLQSLPLPIVPSDYTLRMSEWVKLDKAVIEAYRRISQEFAEEVEMTILYGTDSPQVRAIHERRRKRAIKNRVGNRVEHYRRLNANHT